MSPEPTISEKKAHYNRALKLFLARIAEDRYVLAAVLVGSLNEITIWRKESIHLWIIETDGVSKRVKADGKDERIYRAFVEEGINIHAEIIPRSRFKQMVDGTSRTAFSCNFFAERELVHCVDPSIESWFAQANRVATRDQAKELCVATTWLIHARRHAGKILDYKNDTELAAQELICCAYALACIEIIRRGEVFEDQVLYKAMEIRPDLFNIVYRNVLDERTEAAVRRGLKAVDLYLEENAGRDLGPVTDFLKKQRRLVPLSEMSDHFAHTQLYPWHLEAACEWLEQNGRLEKLSAPFKLTKKSRVDLEEPAYSIDP